MIVNFETVTESHFDVDLCIIGSGVAGIALALEFISRPWRVLVIEGGAPRPTHDFQELYESDVDGLPHHGIHDGRARVYGGTSTLWGGQALPLRALDFQERSWVPHSGWPISLTDLMPYFDRAAAVMQVRGGSYDASIAPHLHMAAPPFSQEQVELVYSQWSRQPNFVRAYHRRLSAALNLQVLQRANVVSIVRDRATALVQQLRLKSLSGREGIVRARQFVLCTGGIETARLLLASDEHDVSGIGNAHGWVGRCFQDHIAVNCGNVVPTDREAFQEIFDQSYRAGIKYLPKLAFGEQTQRDFGALNAVGNVVFGWPSDAAVVRAKELYAAIRRRKLPIDPLRTMISCASGGPELARMLYRLAVKRRSYSPPEGQIYLEAHLEQEPDPLSRVMLSERRDRLGMRRSRLTWRVGRSSWRTACLFAEAVSSEFRRLELGRVQVVIDPRAVTLPWEQAPADLNHHMGTTRMSLRATEGVVDTQCRVHDLDNLHIASSAVFPTSGSSNPTLTLLALTLRLADQLVNHLG